MRFRVPETAEGQRSCLLQIAQQGEHTLRSLETKRGEQQDKQQDKKKNIDTKTTKTLELCQF